MSAKKTRLTIVSPGDDYDPDLHITAKELREQGAKIPDSVLDCAWVPRPGYRPDPSSIEVRNHPTKPNVLQGTFKAYPTHAFTWATTECTLDGEVKPEDLPLVDGVEIVE